MSFVLGEWVGAVFESDSATGNGSTTIFNLTGKLHSEKALMVYIDGILRTVTTHYTVNVGTSQVTFVTAPATAQNIIFRYIKKSL